MPCASNVSALPSQADRRRHSGARHTALKTAIIALLAPTMLSTIALPASAADGCLVLLCLAAPSWSAIPQCVAPIREVFRGLAMGRPFPTCGMGGAGNSAHHSWASAPGFCPPQYTLVFEGESSTRYSCGFDGAVDVSVAGVPWARTWWGFGGRTVTEFFPAAKAVLGNWDTTFDDDYANWAASRPVAPPVDPPGCISCGA